MFEDLPRYILKILAEVVIIQSKLLMQYNQDIFMWQEKNEKKVNKRRGVTFYSFAVIGLIHSIKANISSMYVLFLFPMV